MRGYKESLCLLPWDVHILHHLTHQTIRGCDAAKGSGERLKHKQWMASVPSPSSVTTAQGLELTHGSCYHFCLVRQLNLYQENSLFIKLEKRLRHEPEPITPWVRKRKLADKFIKLQSVLQQKPNFFTLKRYWIQHTGPAASSLGKCSIFYPEEMYFYITQTVFCFARRRGNIFVLESLK